MAIAVTDNRTDILTFGSMTDNTDCMYVQVGDVKPYDPNEVQITVTGLPIDDQSTLVFYDHEGNLIGGRTLGKYWDKRYEQRKQVWLNYK